MQKNEIGNKFINNFHNKSRLIPISNTSIIVSDYIKSRKYHTKITKNKFIETFFLSNNNQR